MNWLKPTPGSDSAKWYVTSDCGRFRIAKALTPNPVYTAIRIPGELLMSGSLEQCKAACEAEAGRKAA